MKSTVLGVVGALVGAVAGNFAYYWLLQQGFIAIMLVGACVGWGAGFAKSPSRAVPIAAGIIAFFASVWAEWMTELPYAEDGGFIYYLLHLMRLPPLTLLFIAIGTAAAVWFSWNRYQAPATAGSRQA